MTLGNPALMSSNAANTPTEKTVNPAKTPTVKSRAKTAKSPKVPTKAKRSAKAKPSAKKTPDKKPAVKKADVKKARVKTAAKTKPVSKAKPPKKTKPVLNAKSTAKPFAKLDKNAPAAPVSKRETVASLSLKLKVLEKRLRGTNKKNRLAIKEIEGVVKGIKGSSRRGSKKQNTALAKRLSMLELQLETYLDRGVKDAKAGVRADFAAITRSGASLSTFENAIDAANIRLDRMDQTQRAALARINRHIADLATSIDTRLTGETQAREADTAALGAKIDSVREHVDHRVDKVEEETANALEAVGAKVAEFAAVLEQRAKSSDSETAERLADLAQETQSEFNAAQSDVTARLEALEVIASAWSPSQDPAPMANPYLPANADDPRIDKMGDMIASLQEELSRMHARIANVQHAAPDANNQFAPRPIPTVSNVLPMTAAVQDNPYAAAAQALETTKTETLEPPQAAPTAPAAAETEQAPRESHIPQEFDPSAFTPAPAAPQPSAPAPSMAYAGTNPLEAPSAALMPPPAAVTPPPMASIGSHAPTLQAAEPTLPVVDAFSDPLMTAPLPVSTYDDPAYAEEDEMRAERIGATGSARTGLPKLPITGRNLRIGGLALGVAVVGLFAAKTFLGGPESGTTETRTAELQNAPDTRAPQNASYNAPAPNSSLSAPALSNPGATGGAPTAPIGQYAETKTPSFGTEAENTLDAAVAAGNPIAQFQKGLVQLQTGNVEDGARLIRLAANRNQPAAQYRLAKLYETATGVAKDEVTARELIERAARGGNRIAMHDLGNYHALGQGGLNQDISEALDWFTKAAERGVVDSQFNVAYLREGNEGVSPDIETAFFWYHVAARQGDPGAPERIVALSERLDSGMQSKIKARADRFNPKPVDEAANGIFRNVAWARPNKAASEAKSAQILKIRDAQTLLSELGYAVGTPDGISGAKTRDAVKSFEAVNGLPQTGQITDDLIERLEIATGA